ncbi:hypothetical protein [uncultured Campylobacter sp.]|uniref:hypothetical protein n=1 Tax=uncultured Campylobacter sp. TaxID=218934 RepID=UPI0025DEB93D|nr:hypothetical protein [uncultured Campylobacter sp.]
MDENSAFCDRQKGLAALQKVCDSKDERDSKLACAELACESGQSRECLNAAKYYQTLLSVNEKMSALFQKDCDERGGMDCLYAKFFDKARDGMTDEYVQKMKNISKRRATRAKKRAARSLKNCAGFELRDKI